MHARDGFRAGYRFRAPRKHDFQMNLAARCEFPGGFRRGRCNHKETQRWGDKSTATKEKRI
jgi:hypothetical protein